MTSIIILEIGVAVLVLGLFSWNAYTIGYARGRKHARRLILW